MTVQGIPATDTELRMSSGFWPRLEPEMVTAVPPSNMPESGLICGMAGSDSLWMRGVSVSMKNPSVKC